MKAICFFVLLLVALAACAPAPLLDDLVTLKKVNAAVFLPINILGKQNAQQVVDVKKSGPVVNGDGSNGCGQPCCTEEPTEQPPTEQPPTECPPTKPPHC